MPTLRSQAHWLVAQIHHTTKTSQRASLPAIPDMHKSWQRLLLIYQPMADRQLALLSKGFIIRTKGMVETNMIEWIDASQICNQISADRKSAPAALNNMAAYPKEQDAFF